MADDKKKAVDILLAFGPKKGAMDDEGAAEPEGDMGLTTAMEDFIAAVKSGDAEGAAAAFKAAYDMC